MVQYYKSTIELLSTFNPAGFNAAANRLSQLKSQIAGFNLRLGGVGAGLSGIGGKAKDGFVAAGNFFRTFDTSLQNFNKTINGVAGAQKGLNNAIIQGSFGMSGFAAQSARVNAKLSQLGLIGPQAVAKSTGAFGGLVSRVGGVGTKLDSLAKKVISVGDVFGYIVGQYIFDQFIKLTWGISQAKQEFVSLFKHTGRNIVETQGLVNDIMRQTAKMPKVGFGEMLELWRKVGLSTKLPLQTMKEFTPLMGDIITLFKEEGRTGEAAALAVSDALSNQFKRMQELNIQRRMLEERGLDPLKDESFLKSLSEVMGERGILGLSQRLETTNDYISMFSKQLELAGMDIGDFLQSIVKVIAALGVMLTRIMPKPFLGLAIVIVGLVGAFLFLSPIIVAVATSVVALAGMIGGAIGASTVWATVTKGLSLAQMGLAGSLMAVAKAMVLFMFTTKIGLLLTFLSIIIGIIHYFNLWDGVIQIIAKVGDALENMKKSAVTSIQTWEGWVSLGQTLQYVYGELVNFIWPVITAVKELSEVIIFGKGPISESTKNLSEWQKVVVAIIAPIGVLIHLIMNIQRFIGALSERLGKNKRLWDSLNDAWNNVTGAANELKDAIIPLIEDLGSFLKDVGVLGETSKDAGEGVKELKNELSFLDVVVMIVEGAVGLLIYVLNGAAYHIRNVANTINILRAVFAPLIGAIVWVIHHFNLIMAVVVRVREIIWSRLSDIGGMVAGIFGRVVGVIQGFRDRFYSAAWNAIMSVRDAIINVKNRAWDAAVNLGQSIKDGIVAGLHGIIGRVQGLMGATVKATKAVWRSSSPSLVGVELGRDVIRGFEIGYSKEFKNFISTSKNLVKKVDMTPNITGATGGSPGTTTQITVNISGPVIKEDTDMNQLADIISRRIRESTRGGI